MKIPIEEKLEMLDELAEIEGAGYHDLPIGLVRHAILNSIPLRELVYFFLAEGSNINSVQDNICKRLEKGAEEIYDQVFNSLKDANYYRRQRFRPILETIIPSLDYERQMEFMTYFISSRYVYERDSAIRLADKMWNEEIHQLFVDIYQKMSEHKILAALIKHVDDEEALSLIKRHWTGSIPKYLVVKLMERLKGRSPEELDFLRGIDPANYIGLLRFATSFPNDELLNNCYQSVPLHSRPFTIWVLGKLGKWDIIEGDIKAFLKEPLTTFSKFSEQRLEKYS